MPENDDETIDITPLLIQLCEQEGVKYDGSRMVVKLSSWDNWRYGILKEYLQDDNDEPNNQAD